MGLIHQVASQVARAQASLPPDGPVTDRFVEAMTRAIVGRDERPTPAPKKAEVTAEDRAKLYERIMQIYRNVVSGGNHTKVESAPAPRAPFYESRGFMRK